jgi:RNA polymerase sigma-70 factor (ECF subfamily)
VERRPPDEEDLLVARARAGDVTAYGELVRRHQAAACRLAALVGGVAADAEDVAQEAFVKAFAALPGFRLGSPFRPWMLAIVANEARNRRRATGRRHHHEQRSALLPPVETAASPEAATVGAEDRAALLAAVQALPDRQRDVVACRYLLELSEADTATVLGLSAGTVKSHLSRGLARLREELGDER